MPKHLLTIEEERNIAILNIHELSSLIFLNSGCWHSLIECKLANIPTDLIHMHYNPCNHYCPYCTKEQEKMIRAISRVGISKFLVDYLIKSAHEQYTPLQLAKKLLQYPNVGRDIYGRRNSKKASSLSETSITILQLISANILHIDVNEGKNPIGICNYISQISSPCPSIMVCFLVSLGQAPLVDKRSTQQFSHNHLAQTTIMVVW